MKIAHLNEQQFDNFATNHKYSSYYQSSSYGRLMNNHGMKPMYLGFYDGSQLIGATLILYKTPFMGFKYGYAPRGLLINYENYSEVINITKELKNYLMKEKFMLLKIDPLILNSKRDKKGTIIEENSFTKNIMETLKSCGYFHCGYSNSFESIKPRWFAHLDLKQDEKELFKKFNKEIRNKIRKANRFGIEISKSNTSIDRVYPFIEKKGNYSLTYYQNLVDYFHNKIEVYEAKINTEKFVEGSRILYDKEQEYNGYLNNIISRDGYKGKNMKDILNKKMESDKLLITYKEYLVKSITLLRDYPEGLTIGGAIVIKEKETVRLLIDGYNKDFGKLCSSYLLRWEIIKDYLNKEYKTLDMNAIVGIFNQDTPYKNLNNLKFGYGAIAHEYLGEFNLIINGPMYTLYKNIIVDDSLKNINK